MWVISEFNFALWRVNVFLSLYVCRSSQTSYAMAVNANVLNASNIHLEYFSVPVIIDAGT
jgi:hypothetical protein